ncbi:RimK family alpha-L-glutamate ligase [Prodigiosinella confusarubida]|uniref:RimK family alpha-L-glutamate ligase n=1 Tax=Serratia sp. (strain ATCC 39006) TaxID=104623 RepID=A0A2I5TIB6_SERS3|nr:RimK family alpha-L-glutamate ligase [Serratia sp. ATCC 39006]AUG99977.1 RimK family alpha-L-glutamate ligase [Serratia sp. ATCC 39006]AUH04297.1 RimK family alpha-L-glutamate ligase [Serratia sp. ATCC 39006]
MSNKGTVFLFVTKLREEEKRIVELLQQYNVDVEIISEQSQWDITDLKRCDVALVRCLSQKRALIRAKYIEAFGVKVINTHRAIEICTDKTLQSILLSKHEIPVPDYRVVHNYSDLAGLLPRFGNRFVIKPISSSWGRGVTLIDGRTSLDVWLSARQSIDVRSEHLPVLVQEYIEKDNFDIRVVIVGRKPVVAFKRVSQNNWKTNTHLGATIIPFEINGDIAKLSNDIVNVIGEGIYGLDLMLNTKTGQYVICEVNQNPEFANSWKVHQVDIADFISNYTIKFIEYIRSGL